MTRIIPFIIAAAVCAFAGAGQAGAQYDDYQSMAYQNMAFDQQFDAWAWKRSVELAQQIPNDQPLPFNAWTIHQSNNAATAAWHGYNQQYYQNSNATHAALDRWGTANQGNWYYGDPHGQHVYELPYQYDSYYVDPYNQYYPGESYYGAGTNVYPMDYYGGY